MRTSMFIRSMPVISLATREAPPGDCMDAMIVTLSASTWAQAFCGSSGACETKGTR